MRAFKRARKNAKAEKPLLLIYQDPFMLSMTNNIFTDIMTEGSYAEMFDLYITDDPTTLNDTLWFKDTHPQLPLIKIIEPSKRVPLEKIKTAKSFLKSEDLIAKTKEEEEPVTTGTDKTYSFTQEVMFMPHHHDNSKLKEQLEMFIDGTNKNGDPLQHYY